MRGIIDAGKLHQQLRLRIAASGGLHRRFGQAQGIDLALDGRHGLRHGVLLELQRLGGLHGQPVVGGIHRGRNPVAELIVHDGRETGCSCRCGMPLMSISILSASSSVIGSLRVMSPDGSNAVLLKLLLHAVDGVVRESLEGVLELDLHHQLGTAAQVEPELDVLLPVGDQLVLGFRNSDDAIEADQDDRDDDGDLILMLRFMLLNTVSLTVAAR